MTSTGSLQHDGGLAPVRTMAVVMLLALLLQFLLGMWLNLFATFPQLTGNGFGGMMGSMMSFMFSGGMAVVMIHMMLGFVIVTLAVVLLAASAAVNSERKARTVLLAAAGLSSIIFAGILGLAFMFSGFQNNVYSYLMAVGFILAFMAYFAELLLLR